MTNSKIAHRQPRYVCPPVVFVCPPYQTILIRQTHFQEFPNFNNYNLEFTKFQMFQRFEITTLRDFQISKLQNFAKFEMV